MRWTSTWTGPPRKRRDSGARSPAERAAASSERAHLTARRGKRRRPGRGERGGRAGCRGRGDRHRAERRDAAADLAAGPEVRRPDRARRGRSGGDHLPGRGDGPWLDRGFAEASSPRRCRPRSNRRALRPGSHPPGSTRTELATDVESMARLTAEVGATACAAPSATFSSGSTRTCSRPTHSWVSGPRRGNRRRRGTGGRSGRAGNEKLAPAGDGPPR